MKSIKWVANCSIVLAATASFEAPSLATNIFQSCADKTWQLFQGLAPRRKSNVPSLYMINRNKLREFGFTQFGAAEFYVLKTIAVSLDTLGNLQIYTNIFPFQISHPNLFELSFANMDPVTLRMVEGKSDGTIVTSQYSLDGTGSQTLTQGYTALASTDDAASAVTAIGLSAGKTIPNLYRLELGDGNEVIALLENDALQPLKKRVPLSILDQLVGARLVTLETSPYQFGLVFKRQVGETMQLLKLWIHENGNADLYLLENGTYNLMRWATFTYNPLAD